MDANSTDESTRDPVSKEVEFITQQEKEKIFSEFLSKRRREEQRRYSLKQSNKQNRLNNFEEEIDNEESDYKDDIDIDDKYIDDEYIDDFDKTRK